MTYVLVLLIGLCAIAALVALVRGLTAFLRDSEAINRNGGEPPKKFGVQQNRIMTQRVLFQGGALLLIALIAVVAERL